MKYIKRFKNKELSFKVDDLVIPIIPLDNKLKKYVETKYGIVNHVYKNGLCEILYKNVNNAVIELMYSSKSGFHEEHNFNTGEIDMKVWLYEKDIRKLTPEEKEKYNIKKSMDKYNL